VDEVPYRAIVDLQATLGEFSHQPAQGKIRLPAPLHQPIAMRSRNLLRPIAADLVRLDTLPVSWKRCTQLIAVLMPTPNWAAA
jgi:hypothetical protein